MYTLQFDGLFKPAQGTNASEQAGFMCYGWLIWKDHRVIARGHGGVARGQAATSNTAEYMALIEGLEALRDMLAPKKSGVGICKQPVTVIGDARSVIDQMQRTAEVSSAGTRPMYLRARRISDQFMQLEWTWMPREKNRAANVERPFHGGRNLAFGRSIGEVQPVGESIRQQRGDDGTGTDEECLHGKPLGALFVRQHVADECAEGLHRDIDRAVHQPQSSCRNPERWGIRHDEQR